MSHLLLDSQFLRLWTGWLLAKFSSHVCLFWFVPMFVCLFVCNLVPILILKTGISGFSWNCKIILSYGSNWLSWLNGQCLSLQRTFTLWFSTVLTHEVSLLYVTCEHLIFFPLWPPFQPVFTLILYSTELHKIVLLAWMPSCLFISLSHCFIHLLQSTVQLLPSSKNSPNLTFSLYPCHLSFPQHLSLCIVFVDLLVGILH